MEKLLSTKFYIPPTRLKLVSRPRLIEMINQGLHRKLTLISAPAGFGKTTLVSEWIEKSCLNDQNKCSIAWLSLDENDNDLVHFLTYLIAALQRAQGTDQKFGSNSLNMLKSPQPPQMEPILTSLINELSLLPGKIALILDDYHLISQASIDDALSFLLDHIPPQMHLVITTRVDPQLPLARFRAGGQLNELRAAELRFSSSEVSEFLNKAMGLTLSEEDITSLESRTEGWIAGLQLAAISMRGREDASSLIKSFTGSHRLVLDYLIEEVLNQQSENVQNFLLKTSILDRMTGPLCDSFTDMKDGRATLEMLDHANLFIIPLDDKRLWYRYHHLFADLLRKRLQQTQPEKLPILHVKASEWFHNQGMYRDAIKHALAGKDNQGAAILIKSIAIDTIQQGEPTTVVEWINALPEELVQEQPFLCVLHAWALQLAGDLDKSESRLKDAENALDGTKQQKDEHFETILGLIHSHRAFSTFMTGEHDKTISFAHQALDYLPETAALIRAQTSFYLGLAYRQQGQLQKALEIYKEILTATQNQGLNSLAFLCYLHIGDIKMDMAQLHQAKEVYEQALKFAEQQISHSDMPFYGYFYFSIGSILRQWNQLENAHRFTTKGLALCKDWNVVYRLALSCIEMAYINQALGNDKQANASIQEAIKIFGGFSPWGAKNANAHKTILDLARGDIDAAISWAQANDLDIDNEFEFHREIEYIAMARVFIAQKRYEEALSLTERIYRIAQEIGKRRTELEALILLALILSMQGKIDQALVYLELALSIGEPSDYIRIFVDEGPLMAQLLYEALDRGISPEYISRLLKAFPEQSPPPKTLDPNTNLIEPLSERECEVLRLIAEGLTNQEIGDRLFLSMNTIKVHARNIFGKLNVSSRTQAVIKAKSLGLLPPE